MMLTLVVAGVVIGCSSEPAAPTTTPVPVVRQIFPVEDIGQFLAQPNPKICEQCYLADADLAGANLTGAYLWSANLSRANLTGADLYETNLSRASLTGANLTGADLDDVIGADFTGALNVSPKYLKD